MIQAEHLSKTYVLKEKSHLFGKKKVRQISAVRDISLEIPKGKITGVLGINGAGKTTTIRMLASLITPTSGSLTMDGVDAVKNHLWVKERINMISGGERNLYWRLTAQENLRYFGSLYGIGKKELEERIGELLKTVGLEEAKDIPVERYSKGMKQRLQIARGLINEPEYLFLDEPTLGLDILIAKEIRELIAANSREAYGSTVHRIFPEEGPEKTFVQASDRDDTPVQDTQCHRTDGQPGQRSGEVYR